MFALALEKIQGTSHVRAVVLQNGNVVDQIFEGPVESVRKMVRDMASNVTHVYAGNGLVQPKGNQTVWTCALANILAN